MIRGMITEEELNLTRTLVSNRVFNCHIFCYTYQPHQSTSNYSTLIYLLLKAQTDPTGTAYAGVENLSSRLIPKDVLLNKPTEVKGLLMDIRKQLSPINYFLGGELC